MIRMAVQDRILADVLAERDRAEAKFPNQVLPLGGSLASGALSDMAREECEQAAGTGELTWWHVLLEEVTEAYAEVEPLYVRTEVEPLYVRTEVEPLYVRTKLVQVAAVVLRILEAIDTEATS